MQLINRQGCSALAGEIALLRLYGVPLNATDLYLSAVQRLTTDDLLASAERYLQPDAIWSGIVRGRTPKPLGSE
jgi:predicted Zn-dependent peptidase